MSTVEYTEESGRRALRAHVERKAAEARERYGAVLRAADLGRLLADPDVVRFPTRLAFDAEPLFPGEFAWARPRGESPHEGFDLIVHPTFAARDDALPLLVAYHLVSINYLDIATHEEAELYGATLLGLDPPEYYARLCALADELVPATTPSAVTACHFTPPTTCHDSCNCNHA